MTQCPLIVKCILGVFLPPVLVFIEKGLTVPFWINLILTILVIWIGGVIHAFIACFGIDICLSIASGLLPPLGVFLHKGVKAEFWICLILTLFFWVPGMIYAYYLASVHAGASI